MDRSDHAVHAEILFEELPGNRAWALFGLAGAGPGSYVTELTTTMFDGHVVVSVADCLDGTAGCPDRYEYEWHAGGRLVAVRSHVDEDVAARLRDGYELLGCTVNRSMRGAECSACRKDDDRCCPGVQLLVGLHYESDVGLCLKAVREEDYDAACIGPVVRPPD